MNRAFLTIVLTLVAALSGCGSAPPPVHPMGARCTWPADVQPAQDGLAVLIAFTEDRMGPSPEIALYDVGSGTFRARCTGAFGDGVGSPLTGDEQILVDDQFSAGQGLVFPPISSDYRLAITLDGVVDLHAGRLIPNPDPRWTAAGMIGTNGVLRRDTLSVYNAEGGYGVDGVYGPRSFCVAARPDTPQDQCMPVPGAVGRGQPMITDDGRVEWFAVGSVAPLSLTGPDGVVFTGQAEPGPTQLLSALIDVSDPGRETRTRLRGDRRYEVFTRMALPLDLTGLPVDPFRRSNNTQIHWYTIDRVAPDGVTGTLHTSRTTYQDLDGPCAGLRAFSAGLVERGGNSIVVGCSPNSQQRIFFRITPDEAPEKLATIPVGITSDGSLDGLPGNPTIYYWPPVVGPDSKRR